MRIFFLMVLAFISASAVAAEGCGAATGKQLITMRNQALDYELRLRALSCLVKYDLGKSEVASAFLVILRDGSADSILKEDLVEALGNQSFRKTVKLDALPSPEVGHLEKTAAERTLASAGQLLEVAAALKTANEVVPVTRYESEIVRSLFAIAQNEGEHILLRKAALEAGEKIVTSMVKSGLYDSALLRQASAGMRELATQDSDPAFYLGAMNVYQKANSDPAVHLALNPAPGRGERMPASR